MNRRKKRLAENVVTGMGILISAAVILIVLTGCSKIQNNLFEESALKADTDVYRYSDPEQRVSSLLGIDVSSRQGTIDWHDVKKSGVKFAYIRIGGRCALTRQIVVDKRFEENLKGAKAAGIKTGVYFYSNAENQEEAVEEAKFVVDQIRNTLIDYPVVYDYEPGITGYNENSAAETSVMGNAVAFCAKIASAGFQPMIYRKDQLRYDFYDTEQIKNIPTWYTGYKKFSTADHPFTVWQYTNQGMVKKVEIYTTAYD